jgi:hypothetical protein
MTTPTYGTYYSVAVRTFQGQIETYSYSARTSKGKPISVAQVRRSWERRIAKPYARHVEIVSITPTPFDLEG